MLFTLFMITLFGAIAFNRVRVSGKVNMFGKRRCSDDLIDILGLRQEYDNTAQIVALPQAGEEDSWLDGEVPWIFNKKNDTDNNSTLVKIIPTPFDPFEPCTIGHLLFTI
jgi:hypothetical protein